MSAVPFNPMDPEFIEDPYPTYHRLRAEEPVHQNPLGFWVLTRYDDVVTALRDPRLGKEAIAPFVAARFGTPMPAVGLSMLDRDPPDHTRLRGLVSKAFTPRVVEGLRPHIQSIVDGLLARERDGVRGVEVRVGGLERGRSRGGGSGGARDAPCGQGEPAPPAEGLSAATR